MPHLKTRAVFNSAVFLTNTQLVKYLCVGTDFPRKEISNEIHVLILIAALLSSCNKKAEYSVDPRLEGYIQEFVNDGLNYGVQVQIKDFHHSWVFKASFGDLPHGSIAVCSTYMESANLGEFNLETTSVREIIVSTRYWESLSEMTKKEVMYHELGHCSLDRSHTTGNSLFSLNGSRFSAPTSIMSPSPVSLVNDQAYSTLKDYYLAELFGARSKSNWSREEIPAFNRAPDASKKDNHDESDCEEISGQNEEGNFVSGATCAIKFDQMVAKDVPKMDNKKSHNTN